MNPKPWISARLAAALVAAVVLLTLACPRLQSARGIGSKVWKVDVIAKDAISLQDFWNCLQLKLPNESMIQLAASEGEDGLLASGEAKLVFYFSEMMFSRRDYPITDELQVVCNQQACPTCTNDAIRIVSIVQNDNTRITIEIERVK